MALLTSMRQKESTVEKMIKKGNNFFTSHDRITRSTSVAWRRERGQEGKGLSAGVSSWYACSRICILKVDVVVTWGMAVGLMMTGLFCDR